MNILLCQNRYFKALSTRALHSQILSEILIRVLSRNEFTRVEMRQVERHFFVIFGKRLLPKLAKTNFLQFFAIFFCKKLWFSWFSRFSRVRKARKLPKYFRNSKNGYFRNSWKWKFRKKTSFAGPYYPPLTISICCLS